MLISSLERGHLNYHRVKTANYLLENSAQTKIRKKNCKNAKKEMIIKMKRLMKANQMKNPPQAITVMV